MRIDELMGRLKVYDAVSPQFGLRKKAGVSFLCDRVEMTVSSTAVEGKDFDLEKHRSEVLGKLGVFLENRPNARIE